jgi:hypothetical protein
MDQDMRQRKESKWEEQGNIQNRIIKKINAKLKMRTKEKNQLVPVEWFVPPLKGDMLLRLGYNISSIIVRQKRRVL